MCHSSYFLIFKINIMKKLMFLTAFMLMYLCSYSQDLTVRNDSAYDIEVTGSAASSGNCGEHFAGPQTIVSGTTGYLTQTGSLLWMTVRAITDPTPGYSVTSESQTCSNSCGTNTSNGLTALWNGCYEVTIDD
jgi:hypothetical protein